MNFMHFYKLLKQRCGSEATQGLFRLFSLYDPVEARKAINVFIDLDLTNRVLNQIKRTGARQILVTSRIDPVTGRDFIDHVQWIAPGIGKMEVKL